MNTEHTQIVFIGRKNIGKSSLVNRFFGKEISVVSSIPGTTTNSVQKVMELLPYGPVVLVDTAGIDENGTIGEKKINSLIKSISSADFAVVILDAREALAVQEVELFFYLDKISLPFIVAVNKIEFGVNPKLLLDLKNLKLDHYEISCKENVGISELKKKIIRMLPRETAPPMIGDLVSRSAVVIFVVPVDPGSHKGRLVQMQVRIIREALDENTISLIVKDKELKNALACLSVQPDLVVTDSNSVMRVAADIPGKTRLTTFSLLISRNKGDLPTYIRGIKKINDLIDGDKILIAEACAHHDPQDQENRLKIPRWLKLHTRKNLLFEYCTGDLPENISDYKLIIHCSGCMLTRKSMHSRLNQALLTDVPVINYGVLFSLMYGAVQRTLIPFPEASAELNLRRN